MSKQPNKEKTKSIELSDWEKEIGIKVDSIEKMVEAGEMYQRLVPKQDVIYKVRILTLPKKIPTKLGQALAMNIEHIQANNETMKKYIITPKSFIQSLTALRIFNALEPKDLIGKVISFQKTRQQLDTENFKGEADVYNVQLIE